MAVKIRLARRGRKKLAHYTIVIADQRAPRDGKRIERVGSYNPNSNPAQVKLNDDAILSWLDKGAQPTETVRQILSSQGLLLRRHLEIGLRKGAITKKAAEQQYKEWKKQDDKKKKIVFTSLEERINPFTVAKVEVIKSLEKKDKNQKEETKESNSKKS